MLLDSPDDNQPRVYLQAWTVQATSPVLDNRSPFTTMASLRRHCLTSKQWHSESFTIR